MNRDTEVPGMQGGLLYALLCNANKSIDGKSAYPADLLLDVPEQTRCLLRKDEFFAFGGTLLAPDYSVAQATLVRLRDGISNLGTTGSPRKRGLGGNFALEQLAELVSGQSILDSGQLKMIPITRIDDEIQQVLDLETLTLHFQSPIRIERPGKQRQHSQSFYNERLFDVRQFLRRLLGRMKSLGIQLRSTSQEPDWEQVETQPIENRLVWLDVAYGGLKGKTLGGVVGRLKIRVLNPILKAALVWGQYARVGKNTSFGFGRFRIQELGQDPYECRRALPLLESAWRDQRRDQHIQQMGLESGIVAQAIQSIREGSYQPHPHSRIVIGQPDKQRELNIPSRRDRVLQRLVLDTISPGLDQLFESSSFAWRKGLGRHNCAKAIAKAFQHGYRFFIRADIDRFFDTIEHWRLFDRLESYLGDREVCELIRIWIQSAAKDSSKGIPTGAPLSPILGNLFLDRFDERVAEFGGRLVRYGDDFMILFREQYQADQLLQVALSETAEVELRLNSEHLAANELTESFEFLGFQFHKSDRWRRVGATHPQRLEELGWFDAATTKPAVNRKLHLTGETGGPVSDLGMTAIVGPDATHLEVTNHEVHCHYAGGKRSTTAPINDLEWLIVLGSIGMSSEVVRKLTSSQTNLLLADNRGFTEACISADFGLSSDVVCQQVDAARKPAFCLAIARELVVAKLNNYRVLAQALSADHGLIGKLRYLADKAIATDQVEALRGFEGAAAAAWFGAYQSFLGNGFRFCQRVAPSADDPVNVLLNIAYMQLYRVTSLAIRSAGLVDTIGFYHVSNQRFEGLASDLMEPFRFLMDRVVIESTSKFKTSDFSHSNDGPYSLNFHRESARRFQLALWQALQSGIQTAEDGEPISYLMQIQRQARRLRRSIVDSSAAFRSFRLP